MKSQRGVTMASLIVYVIALSIIIATVATITNYFYGNINGLTTRTSGAKEYTKFNSYFIDEINTKDNTIVNADGTKIIFSDGNQFVYLDQSIYFNKIKICSNVTSCQFSYNTVKNTITVAMQIAGKTYNNEYTLQNNV